MHDQSDLHAILYERAERYTVSEALKRRIVEATLFQASECPDRLFEGRIDDALAQLLHETACAVLANGENIPVRAGFVSAAE
jgi:hypothetical protein